MITSNVRDVIKRLEALRKGLPEAVARATEPDYWLAVFRETARTTLLAQWASEPSVALRALYVKLTPEILGTLQHLVYEGGTVYGMTLPELPTDDQGATMVSDNWFAQKENLAAARRGILDWVQNEKKKKTAPGERDYYWKEKRPYTDGEIATNIGFAIGTEGGLSKNEKLAAMEANSKLLFWIKDYFNRNPKDVELNLDTLTPEVVKRWFQAVALAWRERILSGLPGKLRYEIGKLMSAP